MARRNPVFDPTLEARRARLMERRRGLALAQLAIPLRVLNALDKAGIVFVADLIDRQHEVRRIRCIAHGEVRQLNEALSLIGMSIDEPSKAFYAKVKQKNREKRVK